MMKKMQDLEYCFERIYPYVFALIVALLCKWLKINIMNDSGYGELLNGLITLDSIIIGFLGAVMPVILSMKNESKFVKYVFERDKENLFCKYLKATLLLGICNVAASLVQFVRSSLSMKMQLFMYYIWVFLSVSFLVATYRSMSRMITLIFMKDIEVETEINKRNISEKRINELKQKFKSKDVD